MIREIRERERNKERDFRGSKTHRSFDCDRTSIIIKISTTQIQQHQERLPTVILVGHTCHPKMTSD
jgi:hypothetical protein